MEGVLYTVATPIGNLADISFHAIEILKSADLIAAEDTRTTSILLQKYGINTELKSYHKFNEQSKTDYFIERIKSGENVALVSDAGTPLISDPGNILVEAAIKEGIRVVPIGGISAVTTFLSSISRCGEDFKFTGFLPRIEGQIENLIKENRCENWIFYESPLRIKETLEIIKKVRPNGVLSIGRELTKKFEEIKTDSISNLIEYYEKNPLKGEIVCMLHKMPKEGAEENNIEEKVSALKNNGFTLKDTSLILSLIDNVPKNKVKEYFLNN